MPSVWSAVTPDSTALGLATLDASTSVIAFSVLPLPPLQSEPRDQDGGAQARNHGAGDTLGKPASSVMAMNGTPRQIVAKITDQRAFQVSPRKSILLAISPILRSDQDTIEN